MVKNYDDMLSRFHTIPACHGQTDRRTDGQTDRIAISISRVSVLTCDKNLKLNACLLNISEAILEARGPQLQTGGQT